MTAYLLSAQVGANPLVILGLLGLLLVLLAGFWHHERRTKYPLMVPEIWQNLVFRRNVTATFINFFGRIQFYVVGTVVFTVGAGVHKPNDRITTHDSTARCARGEPACWNSR
ncbi:hypothetical protein [Secundilactobacillus collinoides]|uniref:hypothetical protein n=1 Tax=Secundilactobacillus collinoides TaxID=33960 RepID=UPI001FB46E70|nr:hypothetical protein [Secundilactobacillus collinoides]